MKKIIGIIVIVICAILIFVGVEIYKNQNASYKITLASYGVKYNAPSQVNLTGSSPSIIIKSAFKENGEIVIRTDSSYSDMENAQANFIRFILYNAKGQAVNEVNGSVQDFKGKGILMVNAGDTQNIKYVGIIPYKNGNNYITYEI